MKQVLQIRPEVLPSVPKVCVLCGSPVNPDNLQFAQAMRDIAMFRFDSCPECGDRPPGRVDDPEWRRKVLEYVKARRRN